MAWDFDWRFPPASKPLQAKGGIRAQSARGSFGRSWWARRWNEVLEGFDLGARLGRGRSYARRGQVLSIDVGPGRVSARVQGSRPSPYEVEITVQPLSTGQWQQVSAELGRRALFAAKLLAGEMPQDIEKVFEAAKVPLFPAHGQDLVTDCSCPDWSNPCKHIAAVYYLLGEAFDRDPFLLFRLRGMEREALVQAIGESLAATAPHADDAPPVPEAGAEPPAADPLPADPERFWASPPEPGDPFGEVRTPDGPAALPARLGAFPFWRGEERLLEALTPVYRNASPTGLAAFLGETRTPAPSGPDADASARGPGRRSNRKQSRRRP